jgi:hypothetical protein
VRRPLSTYALVAFAWALVALFRVALWLVPFARVRAMANLIAGGLRTGAPGAADFAGRAARAVEFASRFVPRATCLPRALATLVLLRARSVPARLRIGVARDESGTLDGHAWVESDGRVVIGKLPNLRGYTVLGSGVGDIL